MHADEAGVNGLSERIIGSAFRVINPLGAGFLENVHDNALAHELPKAGLTVVQQHGITLNYHGVVVGEYTADRLAERTIIIELKAIKALDSAHPAQCINCLKATGLQLCLLLDFGKPLLEMQRVANGLCSRSVHLRPSACICG